jgi:hypothetical protein
MTAATAPRAAAPNGMRLVLLLALVVGVGFGAAFAIGKATVGGSEAAAPVQSIQVPTSKPQAPAIAAPAALPGMKAAPAPEPSGGSGAAPSGGSSGAAPAPTPTPAPAPAPAPAPPSGGGGGGGGGGTIIEG